MAPKLVLFGWIFYFILFFYLSLNCVERDAINLNHLARHGVESTMLKSKETKQGICEGSGKQQEGEEENKREQGRVYISVSSDQRAGGERQEAKQTSMEEGSLRKH